MEHYVPKDMIQKKKRDRKIDRSLLVDLSIDRASKLWFPHHESLFQRLYNYLVIRSSNRHFITIRPSTSYIISRYFNHKIPTHMEYVKWFRQKIKSICKNNIIVQSIENNNKDKIGCHTHIVVCSLSNKEFEKLRVKLREAFTIDHKIFGKQSAVYVSKKDMSTIKKGYLYFLGKIPSGEGYCFKQSYICNDHTLTINQLNQLMGHGEITKYMEQYNEFVNDIKIYKKKKSIVMYNGRQTAQHQTDHFSKEKDQRALKTKSIQKNEIC